MAVCYRSADAKTVHAVNRIDLTVRVGEVLGIIGESGSGKSTLASAIMGLLPGDGEFRSGSILFRGQNVLTMKEAELRTLRGADMTLVPQDPASALNPVMTIGAQISEVLRAHFKLRRKERENRGLELLQKVGFDDPEQIYSAYPHELSGGQRQRVVLAQAVACGPSLVIADEPTSKLDLALQKDILELMARLVERSHAALILITHDPAVLPGFAHKVCVMYAGRIVEEGSARQVLNYPLHPYTLALLRLASSEQAQSRVTKLNVISGEPPDLTAMESGCRFGPRCPDRMPICAEQDPDESTPAPFHRLRCFKYVH